MRRLSYGIVTTVIALFACANALAITGDGRSLAPDQPSRSGIVSGQLVDGAGHPLRGQVWAYLPPVGATGKSVTIGHGKTTSKGHFELFPMNVAFARREAVGNSGWLNLDLIASDGRGYLYRSIPRAYIPLTGKWTGIGGGPSHLRLVLAPRSPGFVPLATNGPLRPSSIPCYDTTTTILESRELPTVVGELHTANDQTATFKYGRSADSEISVGFTVPGLGWSIAGETHVATHYDSALTWTAPPNYHHRIVTDFHYEKRRTFNTCFGTRVTFKAMRWDYDEPPQPVATDPSDGCKKPPFSLATHARRYVPPRGATATLSRDSGRAETYKVAAEVPGLTFSATSGYSRYVMVTWTFRSAGTLCGDTGDPLHSRRVFAGN